MILERFRGEVMSNETQDICLSESEMPQTCLARLDTWANQVVLLACLCQHDVSKAKGRTCGAELIRQWGEQEWQRMRAGKERFARAVKQSRQVAEEETNKEQQW